MQYNLINSIAKEVGNSFYILNEENYLKNLTDMKNSFNKHYDKIIIGYSYKTNYIPNLCLLAKENGIYAEVVSEMELDLALKLGYQADKIIFNGPIKLEKDLEKVLLGNGIINIDSFKEIDILKNIVKKHPNHSFNIGIRINMSLINEDGSSAIQKGYECGRFGFEVSENELGKAINSLKKLGFKVNALHGHISSSDRGLKNFDTVAKTLSRVREEYELNDIEYFNVGGGFFGPVPKGMFETKTPTYEDYAKTIMAVLSKDEWFNKKRPYLILEPGVAIVSNALSYVSKVIDIKKIRTKNFLLIEGGIYNVKPTMHKFNLPFYIISKTKSKSKKRYDVVGSTCMEKDVVLNDVEIAGVDVDDYICIENLGAYTLVKTPEFINYKPAVVSIKDNKLQIIRNRQTLSNLLQQYNLKA